MRPLLLLFASVSLTMAQSGGGDLSAFANGEGVMGTVNALVVQPDGRIIVGGQFTAVNGVAVGNLARLNADGTVDRSFSPTTESGTNGVVRALALQADGKVVVGGVFTQAGSSGVSNLARFNADGSIDASFGGENTQLGTNGEVLAVAIRSDGQIAIGGSFSIVQGQPRRGVALLNANGLLVRDAGSGASLSGSVKTLAFLPSDAIVAGGSFTMQGQEALNMMSLPK